LIINWAEWLDKVVESADDLENLFEESLDLRPLADSAEERALEQTLGRFTENVVFLENEARNLCGFRENNCWKIKKVPEKVFGTPLAEFLKYTLKFSGLVKNKLSADVAYYSVQPLVYGGKYWLDHVCRRELGNYYKNEVPFSVLAVDNVEEKRLMKIVKKLRTGDRPGYFGGLLAVILPGTGIKEAEEVKKRLKDNFYLNDFYIWQVEHDFENLHELKSRVEKKI